MLGETLADGEDTVNNDGVDAFFDLALIGGKTSQHTLC